MCSEVCFNLKRKVCKLLLISLICVRLIPFLPPCLCQALREAVLTELLQRNSGREEKVTNHRSHKTYTHSHATPPPTHPSSLSPSLPNSLTSHRSVAGTGNN